MSSRSNGAEKNSEKKKLVDFVEIVLGLNFCSLEYWKYCVGKKF